MAFLLPSSPHEISKIAFHYQDVRFGTGPVPVGKWSGISREVVRCQWGSGSVPVRKLFGTGGGAGVLMVVPA
jgi:hypothetical protein